MLHKRTDAGRTTQNRQRIAPEGYPVESVQRATYMCGHVVNLDIRETGGSHGAPMIVRRVEIRDGPTVKPCVQQTLTRIAERAGRAHIFSDDQPATGPEEPCRLTVKGRFVVRVAQTFKRPNNIEARARKKCIGVVGLFKADMSGELAPCRKALGLGYLATHGSNANHFGAALLCEPEATSTDTTTGIKNPFALTDASAIS